MLPVNDMKKIIMVILIILLVLINLGGCIFDNWDEITTSIIVEKDGSGDYNSIQEAINNANINDTIYVGKGIYVEHVFINKTVHLISDTPTETIIDGNHTNSVVFVNADNVTIRGFTMRNSGTHHTYYEMDAGININANNTIVSHCFCDNNTVGLQVKHKASNMMKHNMLTNNSYGLFLYYASSNTLSNNTIMHNTDYGCYLYTGSNGNVLRNNSFLKNRFSLRIKSEGNTVFRNLFKDNEKGIYFCCGSTKNSIYHNTVINNIEYNGKGNFLGNTWYNESIGGNYWDDYEGVDADGDGFGDTPYIIDRRNSNNIEQVIEDKYPLMQPMIQP